VIILEWTIIGVNYALILLNARTMWNTHKTQKLVDAQLRRLTPEPTADLEDW
jgi:hypothetical protein